MDTGRKSRYVPANEVNDTPVAGPRVVNVKAKRAARRARKLKNAQARHMRKVA